MSAIQFGRRFNLFVSGGDRQGLDLGTLAVKCKIKQNASQSPNTAEIRVYNLNQDTIAQLKKEFKRVVVQAGYESNYGVVFSGNIKQVNVGRDGVDNFVDIYAGDGDEAYNYSIINKTLAAGANQNNVVGLLAESLNTKGVRLGFVDNLSQEVLPRGKVMFGMTRDFLRSAAEHNEAGWSIQNGVLQVVKSTGLLAGQAVEINSKAGMIGVPEQTNDGVLVKILCNPLIKINGRVLINEKDVKRAVIDESGNEASKPALIAKDGQYRVLSIDYSLESRGVEFYAVLTCIDVDATAPVKKVKK